MADVKGVRRRLGGSLVASAFLLFLDAAFFGSSILSTLICPVWCVVVLAKSVINRPDRRFALFRIGIPAVTFWLVRLNSDFQVGVAEENARRLVAACESYHAASGSFPRKLDELVPQYFQVVPAAKYCLGPGGRFQYHYQAEAPMLVWEVVPPHSRKIYNFGTRSWTYLD